MKVKDPLSDKQLACIAAVQKINNEQHDKVGWQNHNSVLSMSIGGYYFSVDFDINLPSGDYVKIPIYFSENETRIYYEKSDKYEEWYSFIKRRFREIKKELNSIKL